MGDELNLIVFNWSNKKNDENSLNCNKRSTDQGLETDMILLRTLYLFNFIFGIVPTTSPKVSHNVTNIPKDFKITLTSSINLTRPDVLIKGHELTILPYYSYNYLTKKPK